MPTKVTIIGGGTGSSAVINGLKNYSDLELSVIVSMADDGGSNAILRDEFGLLPLSDLRKSIIALSQLEDRDLLREIFTYRFDKGLGLSSHTLGNLVMMALTEIKGSEKASLEATCELFRVKGKILPATYTDSRLIAKYTDGTIIKGEHFIDEPDFEGKATVVDAWLEPPSVANPEAIDAIIQSDFIVVGPGDLYTTTVATLLVKGISESIAKSKAKKIYITSIMSKKGQTRGLTQSEVLSKLKSYIDCDFDFILQSSDNIPPRVLKYYAKYGESLIFDDLGKARGLIRESLIADSVFKRDRGDNLVRSIVRHDSKKLGRMLYGLMRG